MSNLTSVLQHGLFHGVVLSLFMTLTILGSLYLNAEIWLDDYPPDVRAKFGPMSAKSKRQRTWFSIPVFLIIFGLIVWSIVQLKAVNGGGLNFGAVFLSIWLMLMVFNLVDLVIIDWLILMWIRPQFTILPGTEGMAGYLDYGLPLRDFIKGSVGILIASLLIAGITVLLMG
jgi:hypothetical protein